MKEDYRHLDNKQLSDAISRKTQELIELRNELARRAGEKIPVVNYDFTKLINK